MRVVLSSEIAVRRVAVFAELAWMERRAELGLLCRAARNTGNRITPDAVQSALPGLAEAGANNIVAWCRMLRLCDGHGGLTDLGEDVAESDEAPVPEQGVYDVWLAEHPVIGRRVLAVERLASSRDARFDAIEPLRLEPDRGKVFRSVVAPKERFLVRDLPSRHGQTGGIPGQTRATCRLRWTLDFEGGRDQWQLDGEIDPVHGKHAMRSMQHEPESDGLDLWQLVAGWAAGPLSRWSRWQVDDRRLAVAFEGLADTELDTFRKSLPLQRVEVPGKGVYEKVTLEKVPMGPASARDAQRWAMFRFERRITERPGYRSRVEVRAVFAERTEDTPLETFAPALPPHDKLLGLFQRKRETFWSLAAPVDLAPIPLTSEELAEFRVGAPASDRVPESPGVVRVPYRGGWTMRRLADRLLGGAIPAQVLLCDRYVRGDDNLGALKLLVATLRQVSPQVSVEVWTGSKQADVKAIRSITGTVPKSYREVFGRSVPHDRYLLVRPTSGEGFGWQMTNSPLHVRADVRGPSPETPLRWKDFAATRVSEDALQPAFRQWLTGGGR